MTAALDLVRSRTTAINMHPNGFVQFDLAHRDLRLHLWGTGLPSASGEARIHDHRFSFTSRVLVGSLCNTTYPFWRLTPEGYYAVWGCTAKTDDHERQVLGVRHTAHRIELGPGFSETVKPGKVYVMQAREFHQVTVEGAALTIMQKGDVDEAHQARVLVPHGEPYDHSFTRDMPPLAQCRAWETLEDLLALSTKAATALERMV